MELYRVLAYISHGWTLTVKRDDECTEPFIAKLEKKKRTFFQTGYAPDQALGKLEQYLHSLVSS